MKLTSLNALLLIATLNLVLVVLMSEANLFGMFKPKNNDEKNAHEQKQRTKESLQANANENQDGDEMDDDVDNGRAGHSAVSSQKDRLSHILDTMNAVKEQQVSGRGRKQSLDLTKIRAANNEHEDIERRLPPGVKLTTQRHSDTASSNKVQGRGRNVNNNNEEDDEDDQDDDDYSDMDEEEQANRIEEIEGVARRFKDKKLQQQFGTKFVSSRPDKRNGESAEREALKPRFNFARVSPGGKKDASTNDAAQKPLTSGGKLLSGDYWSGKLNKAYKVTKKGVKKSVNVISDIPKYVAEATDSVNAFLQLDGRGKLLALIAEVNEDIHFVKKEFSQFTLTWSPIMEKALRYLGHNDLDKIKWKDNDELDLRRDALHSLVFGFEFMQMMIVWRENLLIAHEAYKLWLESMLQEIDAKRVEVDESVVMQLRTTHTYLLLTSWMTIEKVSAESKMKLTYLNEIEDDQPKNYESEYFRNIIVFQEMYHPTVEEFDQEREQVVKSISTSGVVVDNLKDVDEFYENFRKSCLEKKVNDVDWEVPHELTDFLDKLAPQVEKTPLVYTKGFLKKLQTASQAN